METRLAMRIEAFGRVNKHPDGVYSPTGWRRVSKDDFRVSSRGNKYSKASACWGRVPRGDIGDPCVRP